MANVILLFIVVCIGAYFRFKFDKNYAMPVIKENNNLSSLSKWIIILISVAIVCFILNLAKVAFGILIFLIPFVLYLHFKTYWIAFKNFKRENKKNF